MTQVDGNPVSNSDNVARIGDLIGPSQSSGDILKGMDLLIRRLHDGGSR